MKIRVVTIVLSVGLLLQANAQEKKLPDAQVEANVLRALASAPELSTQDIKTTTVYGVVTLSGSAADEASRTRAEQLASRAEGVRKVIDELTLGAPSQTAAMSPVEEPRDTQTLRSDGTLGPQESASAPPLQRRSPVVAQNGSPYGDDTPSPAPGRRQYPARRPMYNGSQSNSTVAQQVGQPGGRQVTVPAGGVVRIRINQGLSTHHTQPGSVFQGLVMSDVVADGAVAIPRGASVQGVVVNVESSGSLKGRDEIALQLTGLTLGGQVYPLQSNVWQQHGRDKTTHTVNSAIGLGAVGAIIGAVAGGGKGAAIGAGVGGAAGVASSAASPGGRVVIPPEAILTFQLTQPTQITTVSEQEMGRLSYAAGPGRSRPMVRRGYYPPNYGPYPSPGPYYPAY